MMLHSAQPNSVTKVTLNCSNVSMVFDAKMFNFHMLEHTHIPAYPHPCIPTYLSLVQLMLYIFWEIMLHPKIVGEALQLDIDAYAFCALFMSRRENANAAFH